eukprot:INCI222.1.p1 GENE.INCI222.1~~INCI222.1.p1  ORF type:complete len:422 (+),score=64.10 INCI222.1:173-1438(+)
MGAFSVVWPLLNGVTLFFWASAAYHGDCFLFKLRLAANFVRRVCVLFAHKFVFKSARVHRQKVVLAALSHPAEGGDDDESDVVEVLQEREIYFVRHGESTWNEMVNRGYAPQIIVPKIAAGVALEAFLLSSGNRDSKIVDAPLGEEGEAQARALREFLATEPADHRSDWRVLNGYTEGSETRSVLVSSNLRRSLSTILLGFADRFHRNDQQGGHGGPAGDRLLVNPFLQETSLNADCLSIHLPPRRTKDHTASPAYAASVFESEETADLYLRYVAGNTQPASANILGDEQLLQFAQWTFDSARPAGCEPGDETKSDDEASSSGPPLIVGGHSLWFRRFFQLMLPLCPSESGPATPHDCQVYKIQNGGVVAFTLQKLRVKADDSSGSASSEDSHLVYRVKRQSVRNVFRGYDKRYARKIKED